MTRRQTMEPEAFGFELDEAGVESQPVGTRREDAALGFTLARVALLTALLAGPLAFGAVEPWTWSSLIVLSMLALLLWAIGCVQSGALRLVWSPLFLPLSLFLGLALYQYGSHHTLDRIATRECLVKLAAGILVFFVVLQLSESLTLEQGKTLGLLVSAYALGMAMLAILQFFSSRNEIYWLVKTPPGSVVFGPYVNHNHYAGLMDMLIPISAGFLWARPRPVGLRWLVGAAVISSVASVLLSGSRGGMCSLLVEALILVMVLWRRESAHSGPALLTSLVVALIMFLWMDPGNVSKRLGTVFSSSNWESSDLGSRKVVSLDSLRILRDYPWLGSGLGSFETVYTRYRSFASDLDWDHAHDDYAEVLAETGVTGGALILTAVILFLTLAVRYLRSQPRSAAEWMQLGATIACCGLLFHSFMDFNLHIPANAMCFAACAALAQGPVARTECARLAGPVASKESAADRLRKEMLGAR